MKKLAAFLVLLLIFWGVAYKVRQNNLSHLYIRYDGSVGHVDEQATVEEYDLTAKAALRTISGAIEEYHDNFKVYPESLTKVIEEGYLRDDFCGQQMSGFVISCSFNGDGYLLTATPVTMGMTGSKVFTARTNGILE